MRIFELLYQKRARERLTMSRGGLLEVAIKEVDNWRHFAGSKSANNYTFNGL